MGHEQLWFCACAGALNVPSRLHRPGSLLEQLRSLSSCLGLLAAHGPNPTRRHPATYHFAPLLRVYRTSKTSDPQRHLRKTSGTHLPCWWSAMSVGAQWTLALGRGPRAPDRQGCLPQHRRNYPRRHQHRRLCQDRRRIGCHPRRARRLYGGRRSRPADQLPRAGSGLGRAVSQRAGGGARSDPAPSISRPQIPLW